MSAAIIRFPTFRRLDVRIEREAGDLGGWFVLSPDRSHAWLHGSFNDALDDAGVIASGYGMAVQSSAGRIAP